MRFKWYNIGIELGLEVGDLKTIEKDHSNCDDCFREMLTKWLNNCKPEPTWKALKQALESTPIGAQVIIDESEGNCRMI